MNISQCPNILPEFNMLKNRPSNIPKASDLDNEFPERLSECS